MVIVDAALEARQAAGKPLRVGLVGAGVMGRMIALQFLTPLTGLRLVAVANRTLARAQQAYREGGVDTTVTATSAGALERAIEQNVCAVTDDARLLCEAGNVDVVIDATGAVEFGAGIALDAIRHRKHVVLVNAELDSTLGPVLKAHADRAGVVITNTDGDEPGVAMNLLRYLRTLGLRPVAAGNLKGMIDVYRTPETQKGFAEKYGQNPAIVTSFADGTKLAMEETILANAAGFRVGKRGMYGPKCAHVNEIAGLLPAEQMLDGGLVDYALGAAPYTGAFVVVHEVHPVKQKHLAYLKMGDGPFYVFYTPFHLPHVQVPSTAARAGLFGDATTAPLRGPATEVIAVAKKDLAKGERLDGVGGFAAYGVIENSPVVRRDGLLPMGLAEGCVVQRALPKDSPIRLADVQRPAGRLCDTLYAEQCERFPS
ncbi:MAG TPA: Gfo/Idh/MocA family oxidoreductase [Gemmatimonadales bacterium]|nr:Gfo/Idh/MocA family oxidoreductase [Gemmatimonadales bacterium]